MTGRKRDRRSPVLVSKGWPYTRTVSSELVAKPGQARVVRTRRTTYRVPGPDAIFSGWECCCVWLSTAQHIWTEGTRRAQTTTSHPKVFPIGRFAPRAGIVSGPWPVPKKQLTVVFPPPRLCGTSSQKQGHLNVPGFKSPFSGINNNHAFDNERGNIEPMQCNKNNTIKHQLQNSKL